MLTGVVLMSAGLAAVNCADPSSFPAASRNAWHVMGRMEEEELRAMPQRGGRSGGSVSESL